MPTNLSDSIPIEEENKEEDEGNLMDEVGVKEDSYSHLRRRKELLEMREQKKSEGNESVDSNEVMVTEKVKEHEKKQQNVTEDMVQLAKTIKENSYTLHKTIQKSNQVKMMRWRMKNVGVDEDMF